jgi:hypothetical protein
VARSQRIALERKSKKLGDNPFSKYWRTKQTLEKFLSSSLNGGKKPHRKTGKLSAKPHLRVAVDKLNDFFRKRNLAIKTKKIAESLQKEGRRVFVNKRGYIESE